MNHSKYDDDIKAQVLSALLTGQGVNQVARDYSIPITTVDRWKRKLSKEQVHAIQDSKGETLDSLIMGYVRENLVTLVAQTQHFRDESWLKKQSASSLAALHGILSDKTIQLLQAFEQEEEATEGTDFYGVRRTG